MTIRDYIGKAVYSEDGKKLGKVKTTWDGTGSRTSHVLVVGRGIANNVFVPADSTRERGDDLVVGRPWDFIRSGPPLSVDRGKSAADMQALDSYYRQTA